MDVINLGDPEFKRLLSEVRMLRIAAYANHFNLANKISKIGTWNVSGPKTVGKLAAVKYEMKRVGLLTLGIGDKHWNQY